MNAITLRRIAGLSVVGLTLISIVILLWGNRHSSAPPLNGSNQPNRSSLMEARDDGTGEVQVSGAIEAPIGNSESQVRYIEKAVDVVAVTKWRESLGYLDSPLNTSSIAAAYQAYDNDTLERLSDLGDANAQLLLAERYSVIEDKKERLIELYFEAAIAGKTAALTALGTYGFTDKVFGENNLTRVNENGQLTDEYERYLAYFLAAELQQDPVGAALFDFNVYDEHQKLVASAMNDLCAKGRSIVQDIEDARKERGISVSTPNPPPGLFDGAAPNWHCRNEESNS